MDKATRLKQHDGAYADFVRQVKMLTPVQLLRQHGGWAPRDVVAHLIGWNRSIRSGCDEIRAGRVPSYHQDALNDYRTINAGFTSDYDSTEAHVLLIQLAEASQALRNYLEQTSESDWVRDFGPQHYRGGPATIDRCAESITHEYEEHSRQIAGSLQASQDNRQSE